MATARQKLASLGIGQVASADGLTRFELRAPIDGVVTDKRISVGEVVREDAPVFQVADLSKVWVEVNVAAKDLGQLKTGVPAVVRSTAYAAEGEGRLSYLGALVGEQSRSAVARIVLDNAKGQWRPGLPVSVELTADEVEVPLAVATEAVQSLRDWQVVFGRYGQQFEARPLELGRRDAHFVEVLGGLKAGERYAAKNSFLVKADIGKAGASHDH